jgi:hypothetical protein
MTKRTLNRRCMELIYLAPVDAQTLERVAAKLVGEFGVSRRSALRCIRRGHERLREVSAKKVVS